MVGWVEIMAVVVVAVIGWAISFGVLKGMLAGLEKTVATAQVQSTKDSEHQYAAIREMTSAIATLTTNAAVNTAQHDELSRRLSSLEARLGEHEERIRVLRTTAHMTSNKLMELDSTWRPYRQEGHS